MQGRSENLTVAEYDADPALRCTDLKTFMSSRLQYADERVLDPEIRRNLALDPEPPPRKISEAFCFGSAVHAEMNGEEWTFCENGYKTKAFAEAVAQASCPVVHISDVPRVKAVCGALRKNSAVRTLLDRPHFSEKTICWNHDYHVSTGVAMKCRLDRWLQDGTIPDFKTTSRFDRFSDDICNYRYDIQGAFYVEGARSLIGYDPEFVIVAVESHRPYRVQSGPLPPSIMDDAHRRIAQHLKALVKCRETGDYLDPESATQREWNIPRYHYFKHGIEL